MIIRNWPIPEVTSHRDADIRLFFNHRTALRLYGVIGIMPLRGILEVDADNH